MKVFFLAFPSHNPLLIASIFWSDRKHLPHPFLLAVLQNLLLPIPAQGGQKTDSQQGSKQSHRTLHVEWNYV